MNDVESLYALTICILTGFVLVSLMLAGIRDILKDIEYDLCQHNMHEYIRAINEVPHDSDL